MHNDTETAARFWAKVDKAGECWVWLAQKRKGYGRVRVEGRLMQAHRLAYILLVGPIPEGMTLDHLCRNRACIRPDHLEPVSNRTNILRGVGPTAVNAARTTCKHGHELTEQNTYVTPDGRRQCRVCIRARLERSYARRAARGASIEALAA